MTITIHHINTTITRKTNNNYQSILLSFVIFTVQLNQQKLLKLILKTCIFASPLFCKFRDLGRVKKITGREYLKSRAILVYYLV